MASRAAEQAYLQMHTMKQTWSLPGELAHKGFLSTNMARPKQRKRLPRPWRLRENTLYRCELADAAERLGLTLEGIRRHIRSGRVKAYKAGGRWYVIMPMGRRR